MQLVHDGLVVKHLKPHKNFFTASAIRWPALEEVMLEGEGAGAGPWTMGRAAHAFHMTICHCLCN